MRCLLDPCTFLWIVAGAKDLSPAASQIFANLANEVFLSAVFFWELSVKQALGKLPLPGTLACFLVEEREQQWDRRAPAERASRSSSAQTSPAAQSPV